MKKVRLYLSGNMTPYNDEYYNWTHDLESILKDSHKYEVSVSKYKDCDQFIVQHDLARLKRSDALIINLGVADLNYHMTGAVVEVYEAYKQNMPVYAFTGDNLFRSYQARSPWMSQFITKEFDSFMDMVDFLIYEDNL